MAMTSNDRAWGPFTVGPWSKQFSLEICSMSRCDDEFRSYLLAVGFGWAIKVYLPFQIKSHQDGPCVYGVSISDMGNGYDFVQVKYGPQTWDSLTTKSWCKHLPWKQWNHVRTSLYDPEGNHFYDEEKKKWDEFYKKKEECPKCHFKFLDCDGQEIIATCMIEEMEWRRGEGLFKWLKYFYPKKIRTNLDLQFSEEVGPEKGSWRGGIIGHSVGLLAGEKPEDAFRRYCQKEHSSKHRKFVLRYIGPCDAPPPKPKIENAQCDKTVNAAKGV